MDGTFSYSAPICLTTSSTAFSHFIPALNLVVCSHISPSARAGNVFSRICLTFYINFNFLDAFFVIYGYIHSSAPSTILFAALDEIPWCLFSFCHLHSSGCFTNSASPSHTSPMYCRAGTTTFIRIQVLILV